MQTQTMQVLDVMRIRAVPRTRALHRTGGRDERGSRNMTRAHRLPSPAWDASARL